VFERFDAALSTAGFLAMSGQIIGASIVAAPKQRNTDGEKRDIREGRIPAVSAGRQAQLRQNVFARQKGPMGLFIRTIGIARASTKIGLANLVYNMQRMVWLAAQTAPT
jgi:hypothetical protein